jgi:hypothetical protein
MAEATRWALHELVDFDTADARVAVLPAPETSDGRSRRLYAVAAPSARVDEAVSLLRDAGLDPVGVEIPETSLLNLAPWLGDPADGQAFLRLAPKHCRFGVVRGGQLCMTRDLAADPGAMEGDDASARQAREDLLLEVQRSLDYFESQFGRVPAARLWVFPSEQDLGELVAHLDANLTVPVQQLDLARLLEASLPLPLSLQDRCLGAVSAALCDRGVSRIELWSRASASDRPPWSAAAIGRGAAVLAAGLVAVALGGAAWNLRLEDRHAELAARVETTRERVAALEARVRHEPDPALLAEVEALRREREHAARVLAALDGEGLGNVAGFSAVLEGLARRRVAGVWLDGFGVRAGGGELALSGGALRPELVPRWLEGLRAEPGLAGRAFRTFELGPPAEGRSGVSFHLDTAVREDPS